MTGCLMRGDTCISTAVAATAAADLAAVVTVLGNCTEVLWLGMLGVGWLKLKSTAGLAHVAFCALLGGIQALGYLQRPTPSNLELKATLVPKQQNREET